MAEVKLMHRTIGDLSKEPANIPTGVWQLRLIKITAKDVTKKNRDGEEYDTVEYMLSAEPVAPTASVDPQALDERDPETGKPVYEGKRLFLRFVESFRSDMKLMGEALSAAGFSADDDLGAIVAGNRVKGKTVYGEIHNRTFTRNDGSPGTEQKVRAFAAQAGGTVSGFAL